MEKLIDGLFMLSWESQMYWLNQGIEPIIYYIRSGNWFLLGQIKSTLDILETIDLRSVTGAPPSYCFVSKGP